MHGGSRAQSPAQQGYSCLTVLAQTRLTFRVHGSIASADLRFAGPAYHHAHGPPCQSNPEPDRETSTTTSSKSDLT